MRGDVLGGARRPCSFLALAAPCPLVARGSFLAPRGCALPSALRMGQVVGRPRLGGFRNLPPPAGAGAGARNCCPLFISLRAVLRLHSSPLGLLGWSCGRVCCSARLAPPRSPGPALPGACRAGSLGGPARAVALAGLLPRVAPRRHGARPRPSFVGAGALASLGTAVFFSLGWRAVLRLAFLRVSPWSQPPMVCPASMRPECPLAGVIVYLSGGRHAPAPCTPSGGGSAAAVFFMVLMGSRPLNKPK